MAYNEKTYQAANKYKQANIKRIPLDIQLSEYNLIKQAAQAAGQAVNTYIKQAIKQRMETGE